MELLLSSLKGFEADKLPELEPAPEMTSVLQIAAARGSANIMTLLQKHKIYSEREVLEAACKFGIEGMLNKSHDHVAGAATGKDLEDNNSAASRLLKLTERFPMFNDDACEKFNFELNT